MDEKRYRQFDQFIRGADFQFVFDEAEQSEMIAYGVQKLLIDDGSPQATALLQLAIMQATDQALIDSSYAALQSLAAQNNHSAVETLFTLYLEYAQMQAGAIIQENGFLSSSSVINAVFELLSGQISKLYENKRYPYLIQSYYQKATPALQTRMLEAAASGKVSDWLSITEWMQDISTEQYKSGVQLYESLPQSGKRFFCGRLINTIVDHQFSGLQFAVHLFCKTDEPVLQNYLRTLPEDSLTIESYAMFLLFDEQWLRYQQFDPANRYLNQLYNSLDNELRMKILHKTRSAGIAFSHLSGNRKQKIIGMQDLTVEDWQSILGAPENNANHQKSWQLAQLAPPYWSAALLRKLNSKNWQPSEGDECEFWTSLQDLIPVDSSNLFSIENKFSFSDRINAVALRDNMAALNMQEKTSITLIHDITVPHPEQTTIIPPRPLLPVLDITPNKDYLLWADVDQYLNIYEIKHNRLLKRFKAHENIIRACDTSADQRTLFSTGFDGAVIAWRFPDGSQEKTLHQSRNEIYSMGLSHQDKMLFSGDITGGIQVFSTRKMTFVHKMSASSSPVLLLSNPVSGLLCSYHTEKRILLWNYRSGRMLNQFINPEILSEKVTCLHLSQDLKFLLIGTSTGQLAIVDPLSGKLYENITLAASPVLAVETDENNAWVIQQNGDITMVFTAIWQQLLTAITAANPHRLRQIDDLLSVPAITNEQIQWLVFIKSLLQWQKRFDISITEIKTPIRVDEYSITI